MPKHIVAFATLAVVIVAAGAAVATSTPEITTARVIRVVARADNFKARNAGPEKPTIGDQYFISGALLSDDRMQEVGRFDVTCGLTDTRAQTNNCHATFSLEGGEIVTGGVSRNTGEPDVDAVYGGTGIYRNARGVVHVGNSAEQFVPVVFRLLP